MGPRRRDGERGGARSDSRRGGGRRGDRGGGRRGRSDSHGGGGRRRRDSPAPRDRRDRSRSRDRGRRPPPPPDDGPRPPEPGRGATEVSAKYAGGDGGGRAGVEESVASSVLAEALAADRTAAGEASARRRRSKWDDGEPPDQAVPTPPPGSVGSAPGARLGGGFDSKAPTAGSVVVDPSFGLVLPAGPAWSRPQQVKEIRIPANTKGRLIGKGGEHINFIREKSGAIVKLRYNEGDAEAVIELKGAEEVIQHAEVLIHSRLQEVQGKIGDWENDIIDVPKALIGETIGKGGENLNIIANQSGCKVRFAQANELDPNAPAGKQVCLIRGPPDKLPYARTLVLQKVEEVMMKKNMKSGGGCKNNDFKGGGKGGKGKDLEYYAAMGLELAPLEPGPVGPLEPGPVGPSLQSWDSGFDGGVEQTGGMDQMAQMADMGSMDQMWEAMSWMMDSWDSWDGWGGKGKGSKSCKGGKGKKSGKGKGDKGYSGGKGKKGGKGKPDQEAEAGFAAALAAFKSMNNNTAHGVWT